MNDRRKKKDRISRDKNSLGRKAGRTRPLKIRNVRVPRKTSRAVSVPKESDELYKALVNALPEAILLTDCKGIISYASNPALEILAYSRQSDLVGTSLFACIAPLDRVKMTALFQEAVDGFGMYDSRIRIHRRNDTAFIGEISAVPHSGSTGTPKGIVIIIRDITERDRNEIALRESEEKFRLLADKLPNMVFINKKGRVVYTNDKSIEALGYSREELYAPDFNFLSLTVPEHHDSEKRNFRLHLEGKEVPAHEYALLTKEGRRIDALIETTLIKYEGESAILGIVTDITDRKRTEEIIRESERRFKEILHTVHLASVVLDRSGDIIFCNDYLLKITGYGREEVIGRNWFDIFLPEDEAGKVRKIFFELLPLGELPHYFDNSILTRDGNRRSIRWNNTVLRDPSGAITGSASIGEDVTDRTRAEEALRLAQKMESLGVLAGGIAHDFNNLLHAMLGQHHLALRKLPPDSPARDNVEKAQNAADRAADLTRKLLAYSGRGKYDIRPVDLTEFIRESIHLLEVAIPKSVTLSFERAEPRLIIEADVAQLQQIVMNLVINAAEAMEEKIGLIQVSSYSQVLSESELTKWMHSDEDIVPGRFAILEVSDNGTGMGQDVVNKIFDPFFTTKFAGRGLGLAAVLGIVRGHHGGLEVISAPGKGTTFRVAFPASNTQLPGRNRSVHTLGTVAGTGRILLIDDEPGVREVFHSVLSEYGASVVTAASGEEGLDLYRRERDQIILVVLDLSMPGMGGEETFRQMKAFDPAVRIVLSSGYDEEDATRRFEGLGLTGFIQKPYDWDAIEETLIRFLK